MTSHQGKRRRAGSPANGAALNRQIAAREAVPTGEEEFQPSGGDTFERGPFDIILDQSYPDRAKLTRTARRLMIRLERGLPPPPPGPKTTFLLRQWHRCETGGASWPWHRLASGISCQDDYSFLRWLMGEPDRCRQIIVAAQAGAGDALCLLAHRRRQARERPSEGGQWFHVIRRAIQRWYADLPLSALD